MDSSSTLWPGTFIETHPADNYAQFLHPMADALVRAADIPCIFLKTVNLATYSRTLSTCRGGSFIRPITLPTAPASSFDYSSLNHDTFIFRLAPSVRRNMRFFSEFTQTVTQPYLNEPCRTSLRVLAVRFPARINSILLGFRLGLYPSSRLLCLLAGSSSLHFDLVIATG